MNATQAIASSLMAERLDRSKTRLDLIRAVEIIVRAAIVDADTYQAKVDLAALGSQIIALVGNSKL